jgi:DNA polymerase I
MGDSHPNQIMQPKPQGILKPVSPLPSDLSLGHSDEILFGWNPTPGIVSVWADRSGEALVWQRDKETVTCSRQYFTPWLFATSLADVNHLGKALVPATTPFSQTALISYRELKGNIGSYRYLLCAPRGGVLDDAICKGASQRLGQPVQRVNDVDGYYRVGAVEQFLMQSGQVYFRGLEYANLHRLQFDLETTALSPNEGRIFLVAVRDSQGLEQILEAPHPEDEASLLTDLCTLIRERDPDVLENHNLLGFDLPFLHERAEQLGVPLLLGRKPGPLPLRRYEEGGSSGGRRRVRFSVAGRELIDTLDAVRRHDFIVRDLPSHGLKAVAKAFGVARPERVYIPGAAIAKTYQSDPETVRRYALDDVAEVNALSQRLLGPAFALASMTPRSYERVASAGPAMGILEPLLVRAYLREGSALPAPSGGGGTGTSRHAGGAAYLFATGVAQQVVKADIASLYPSLMRLYNIGPTCDPLGVLVALVDRLTDLRLHHKSAARTLSPNSLEGGRHHAIQAAMKLVINSAYGYMGAGEMALFGDPQAADEVTRRGREVLDGVVEALRVRGVALIEADTDGVYFAVPFGWTEVQERTLVAEVGATLPKGLHLEYDGRYRAMFSHEVKNYALLTYSGELVVRGVALRSSRSEPFGERFLHEALRCTLVGNVAGVRQTFLDTVYALRARTLPVAEVATRIRLTKRPELYLKTRERHREFAYEALLAAGQRQWRTGTKIRCYHGAGGQPVWLPDESDDGAEDGAIGAGQTTPIPTSVEGAHHDYDVEHYVQVLVTSYASRLRKAYTPEAWKQLFRLDAQLGLWDQPLDRIEPLWIRCD